MSYCYRPHCDHEPGDCEQQSHDAHKLDPMPKSREILKKLGLRGESFDMEYLRRMGLDIRLTPDQFEAALRAAVEISDESSR